LQAGEYENVMGQDKGDSTYSVYARNASVVVASKCIDNAIDRVSLL